MLPPIVMADFAFQEGVLLRDLSESGLGAHALVSPAVGTSTSCIFELPEDGRIEASGTVTWSDNSGRFGLRFDVLSDSSRTQLSHWLARNAELAPEFVPDLTVPPPASPADDLTLLREQLETGKVRGDAAFQLLTESIRAITGATGAAIAIEDDGAIVCRASSGNAPDVGAHLDPTSGLSGECVRSADAVRCADTESDPRVDRFVCRKLEIRSAVIVPILREEKVVGVVEVFSSAPHAFQNNAVRLLRKAAQVLAVLSHEAAAAAAPVAEISKKITDDAPAASAVRPKPAPAVETTTAPVAATKQQPEAAVEPPFVPLLPAEDNRPPDQNADAVLAELRAKKLAELAAQQMAADKAAQKRAAKVHAAPAPVEDVSEDVSEDVVAEPGLRLAIWQHPALRRLALVAALLVLAAVGFWRFWPKSVANSQPPAPIPSTPVSTTPAVTPMPVAAISNTPTPAAPTTTTTPTPKKSAETPKRAAEQFDDVQIRSVAPAAPAATPAANDAAAPPPISLAANGTGGAPVSALLPTSVRQPTLAVSAPASSGVTGGRVKSRVEPIYPATARAMNLSGTVVLNATVDASGKVIKVTRVSGNPVLAEAAAAAVRRWTYEPFMLNGKAVQTDAQITVKFAGP